MAEIGFDSFWGRGVGDVTEGRPTLGPGLRLEMYRLMLGSMRAALVERLGEAAADEALRRAGRIAGGSFRRNVIGEIVDFEEFGTALTGTLRAMGFGLLTIDAADAEKGTMTVTVREDLDCAGLPVLDRMLCAYSEGFLAGVLEGFFRRPLRVRETECWGSGSRACRFEVKARQSPEAPAS